MERKYSKEEVEEVLAQVYNDKMSQLKYAKKACEKLNTKLAEEILHIDETKVFMHGMYEPWWWDGRLANTLVCYYQTQEELEKKLSLFKTLPEFKEFDFKGTSAVFAWANLKTLGSVDFTNDPEFAESEVKVYEIKAQRCL